MKHFPIDTIRDDFPILDQTIHGHPLAYLDNAASTQKPQQVIDAIQQFYSQDYANVHRGIHQLSERATSHFENARETVRQFIQAKESAEIIFVRGTTEAINLVAQTLGRSELQKDDEIIISEMEHHSNIVPWQMIAAEKEARLRVIPVIDSGELDLEAFQKLLTPRTKIVAITHLSNAMGIINPVKDMIKLAHQVGAKVLVDGAQAAPHLQINVQDLDCDFYTFSSHKVYGPCGIGVLYGKTKHLNNMPPYQGGGDMINRVSLKDGTTYAEIPYKFEAGTPNMVGAFGLAKAIDYLNQYDMTKIAAYENDLLQYASCAIREIPNINIMGTANNKASILAFYFDDIHAHDVGTILDHDGVAIRSGHHCAMPLMDRFDVPATSRASFALYNTKEEIDRFIQALWKVRKLFG